MSFDEPIPFPTNLDVQRLRYPGELAWLRRTLCIVAVSYLVFSGLTLLLWMGWFVLSCVTVMVLRNRYPSVALEVGPNQLPRVHALVERLSQALEVKPPRVFLSEDPGKRPIFSVPLPETAIMLNAAWVKMLEEEELAYFLAKELAHGKLGHRFLLNPIHVLENVGPISWVLTTPLEIIRYALRPWMRKAEFSADRVALAMLGGDLKKASSALAKVTAGEELFDEVNAEAFLDQCRTNRFGLGLTLFEVLTGKIGFGSRLHQLIRFAQQSDYAELTQGTPLKPPPGIWQRFKSRFSLGEKKTPKGRSSEVFKELPESTDLEAPRLEDPMR